MKKIKLTDHDKEEILKASGDTDRKWKTKPYQAIGSVKGFRNTDYRCEFMNLPNDFEGKSVLDIGCNLGAMCIAVKQRGAGRVVGIDKATSLVETASDIFNRHGYDISLISYDMNKQGFEPLLKIIGEEKFDYIFALSIYHHVNNKKVLWDIINNYCSGTCWFEGHKRNSREELEKDLSMNLNSKINFIGDINDHVRRSVFRCTF